MWEILNSIANVAEHDSERAVHKSEDIARILLNGDGRVRRESARAFANIAATHPGEATPYIHDIIRLLDVEDDETNAHLVRTLQELLRSDTIAQSPAETRRTALRTLWRSSAYDLPTSTDVTPASTDDHTNEELFTTVPGDETEVKLLDRVERRMLVLEADDPVSPEPTDHDPFAYPVDYAWSIRTSAIELAALDHLYVRDRTGELIADGQPGERLELSAAQTYFIELPGPVKTYLLVDGSVHIDWEETPLRLEFEECVPVQIGVRSRHEAPAGTITTSEDPAEMMVALSRLGTALKTTSCERSFPTLRGHPPEIELGDELSIPPGIGRPETGVMIEVPPDYEAIFAVAPLAFYLGAAIVPGETPQIVTATEWTHSLDPAARSLEAEVERVLKQVFLLDSLARTEGIYAVELEERQQLEALTDLDFAALYDKPLCVRLRHMLAIPYELVDPFVPTWPMQTTVTAEADNVETIPFLVNDLSIIHTIPEGPQVESSSASPDPVASFLRGDGDADEESPAGHESETATTRSADGDMPVFGTADSKSADAFRTGWVGDGMRLGSEKLLPTAFRNRLHTDRRDAPISVTVVCNDIEMADEMGVTDRYQSASPMHIDVETHSALTCDELAAVLREPTDLFHYIGHVDDGGFRCADGVFDAENLSHVGAKAFILNACRSVDQGCQLVEAGAQGGVVTLSDVINAAAVRTGQALATLLEAGFTLSDATDLAKTRILQGESYSVVGNGGVTITQSESAPTVIEVSTDGEGPHDVTVRTYPTPSFGIGTLHQSLLDDENYRLAPGAIHTDEVENHEELRELNVGNDPLLIDGELVFSGPEVEALMAS